MKYPGSKWGSADWIISHFPEHHSYLEPFFGSGGVFFNKPRSDIETINDLDGEVVNLFRQIRNDPERLAREIYFTPYSREAYEMAYQKEPENDLEKAVLFYTRLNMGHGFRTQGEKVGWKLDVQGREKAYAAADWCKIPEKIMEAAERLRGVQIENRPAVEVIRKFNFENVLIYCDPPYVLSTRCRKQYRHEMTDEDHEALLEEGKKGRHAAPKEIIKSLRHRGSRIGRLRSFNRKQVRPHETRRQLYFDRGNTGENKRNQGKEGVSLKTGQKLPPFPFIIFIKERW